MIKKVPFLSILGLLSLSGLHAQTAQKTTIVPKAGYIQHHAPSNRARLITSEISVPQPINAPVVATHSGVNYRSSGEEIVSETAWDAQSYGCLPERVYANNAGDPVVGWIFANQPTAFPERGTGVNSRTGGTWGNASTRVESIRTGFGAIARLSDGTDLVIAHATGLTPNELHLSRRAPGAATWVETNLPNPGGYGMLWPAIATSGNTIHVIGISIPVANMGVLVDSVDGQLFYYRSTDGGTSWDKAQVKFPGIDKSKLRSLGANNYAITARGNTVAVAILPDWNDLMVLKSTDNGTNWSQPIRVYDFPDGVENYAGALNDSYTLDDIGGVPDPDRPNLADSLAVRSTDGFGSLLIDKNDALHLFFGRMYIIDVATTAGTSYYPGVFGIDYWREDFGADSTREYIAAPLDLNGDTVLTLTGTSPIGPYFNSLSSFATAGEGADGTIYLGYSAVNELYRSGSGSEVDQYYRHIYIQQSKDGGETWAAPLDITAGPYLDPDIASFTEAVYPYIPKIVGDEIWVAYQSDFLPGTNLWGANHTNQGNTISFISVPKADLPVGTKDVPRLDPKLSLTVNPNPVTDAAQVSFSLAGHQQGALVQVTDMLGHVIYTTRLSNTAAGQQSITLQTSNWPLGIYTVQLVEGQSFGITRVVKVK